MIRIDKDPTLQTLAIQEALKARGLYTGELDNDPGPMTDAALAAFRDLFAPESPLGVIDSRTAKNIATLDPKARRKFESFVLAAKSVAAKHGCEYVGISGNRSWGEQDELYAKGRTSPGKIVTNARGGYSNHNFGIAMDFGVFRNGVYLDGGNRTETALAAKVHTAVAVIARPMGIEWGGDWKSIKDLPHFEIASDLTLAQKRETYSKKNSVLA